MSRELVRDIEASLKSVKPIINDLNSGYIVCAEIDFDRIPVDSKNLIEKALQLKGNMYFLRDNNQEIIFFDSYDDANYYSENVNKKNLMKKIFYYAYKENNMSLKESETELINIGKL